MKKNKLLVLVLVLVLMISSLALTGCTGGSSAEKTAETKGAPEINGLKYESAMKLDYAKGFDVYYYNGGYALIDVHNDAKYLVVPKNKQVPKKLDSDIVIIKKPVKNIYLAATSSMALFSSMDAMQSVTMTSLRSSEWTVQAAVKEMNAGKIVYAGKYSQPDYEMLLDKNCHLAIESTMIYHTPEVKEMIEDLDIPVLVDRSSYESNPLGRTEWIKLYGVLADKEKNAVSFFNNQEKLISQLKDYKNTEKTVAFFYVTSDGKVVVRSSNDYIPAMIEMAGGRYVFKDLTDSDGKTSIPMTMETFYDKASDADYIIYNGSIDGTVSSISDLENKDPLFKKFKAVKSGNCYATGSSMYQRTDVVGNMVLDFHKIFTSTNPKNLEFLTKLE